jgi:hypothetical protein
MGDHLVGDRKQLVWNGEVERLGGGYGRRPGRKKPTLAEARPTGIGTSVMVE